MVDKVLHLIFFVSLVALILLLAKYQMELREARDTIALYEEESRKYRLEAQAMKEEVSKKVEDIECASADKVREVAKSLEKDPSVANEYKLMEELANEFCRKAAR